jgi:hypothetical protein
MCTATSNSNPALWIFLDVGIDVHSGVTVIESSGVVFSGSMRVTNVVTCSSTRHHVHGAEQRHDSKISSRNNNIKDAIGGSHPLQPGLGEMKLDHVPLAPTTSSSITHPLNGSRLACTRYHIELNVSRKPWAFLVLVSRFGAASRSWSRPV